LFKLLAYMFFNTKDFVIFVLQFDDRELISENKQHHCCICTTIKKPPAKFL